MPGRADPRRDQSSTPPGTLAGHRHPKFSKPAKHNDDKAGALGIARIYVYPAAHQVGMLSRGNWTFYAHGCRYNSVFYSSLGATNYYIFYVNDDFVNGVPPSALPAKLRDPSTSTNILEVQRNLSTYVRLDNLECIRAYAADIPTEYRTLVIVTSAATDPNNSFIDYEEYSWAPHIPPVMASGGYDPYDW